MPSRDEHAEEQRQPSYLVYLLISLVFILLIVPVIEQRPFATGLLRVGLTAVLLSAAIATRRCWMCSPTSAAWGRSWNPRMTTCGVIPVAG